MGEKYITEKFHISGIVQGVGFRPFVYNLAKKHGFFGFVLNDSEGVKIHIQNNFKHLDDFCKEIKAGAPVHSHIEDINRSRYESQEKFNDFIIRFSENSASTGTQISPDLDLCDDCLAELFDERNPRYLYPFINCTNCGPRFTITKNIPYDRRQTTMAPFTMCTSCRAEYDDPANRRFHAQPNGCHHCGPTLRLTDNQEAEIASGRSAKVVETIFQFLTRQLAAGKIIALKGIGGFHLACDAQKESAVARLRQRKYREDKPFAVMFSSVNQVRKYCFLTKVAESQLTAVQHPIVLLDKKKSLAKSVAPGNQQYGSLLPYSPIHHILMKYYVNPLVMTSGNVNDEPVKYDNQQAFESLADIADYFLVNNRKIHIRCDDSVVQIHRNQPYFIRRSRGYVPAVLGLSISLNKSILACGAEQKNVFALSKKDKILLSHHIGDLKNYEVLHAFESGVQYFKKIFEINPSVIAVDKHPNYLNTQFGEKYAQSKHLNIIHVQHHHAHAAACMADNGLENEPVIGLILDGTGYGSDGHIWGGECLVCDYDNFRRVGHVREAMIPGGDMAIQSINLMGLSYLFESYGKNVMTLDLPFFKSIDQLPLRLQQLEKKINSPYTSSCGRLFDGVAAICGFRHQVNYEGQAAIELEQQIHDETMERYTFELIRRNDKWIIDWKPMIRQVVDDAMQELDYAKISEKFHRGLVNILFKLLNKIRLESNINKVVLSGGVFMNMFLLKTLEKRLLNDNFRVYTHKKVPTNDGGIALGQLLIANQQIINHQ